MTKAHTHTSTMSAVTRTIDSVVGMSFGQKWFVLCSQFLRRYWPFAALFGLAIAPYWQLATTDSLVLDYDVVAYFFPYRQYAAQILRTGHIPLWNPYLFSGAPFLANIQTAVLYPPNLLYLVLPTSAAINWSIILHVFVAGASTFAYARRALRLERFGAMVAATSFMYSGFFAAHTGHLNQVATASWAPLVLLSFHLAIQHQTPKSVACSGAVLAMQLLAGHPQEFYYTVLVVAAYVPYIALVLFRPGWATVRALFAAAAAVLAACAFAAAQLFPTLELSGSSYRSGSLGVDQAAQLSVPPHRLLESILPGFTGAPYVELVGYTGILTLVLAVVALVFALGSPYVRFYAVVALAALGLSVGRWFPMYQVLFDHLPGFSSFRVPGRWLMVYVLSVSVIAGIGAEVVFRRAQKSAHWSDTLRFLAPLLVCAGAIAFLSHHTWRPGGELLWVPNSDTLEIWVGVACFSILLIAVVLNGRMRGPLAKGLIATLMAVELLCADRVMSHHHVGPPSLYAEQDPSVSLLLARATSDRMLSLVPSNVALAGESSVRQDLSDAGTTPDVIEQFIKLARFSAFLSPNASLVDRLRTADGYDGGLLPTGDFVGFRQTLTPGKTVSPDLTLRDQIGSEISPHALALLGVRYVLVPPPESLVVDSQTYDVLNLPALSSSGTKTLDLYPGRLSEGESLGILSFLGDSTSIRQGEAVAEVDVVGDKGQRLTLPLRAGVDTAEWALGKPDVAKAAAHSPARIAGYLDERKEGQLYFAMLKLPDTMPVQEVHVRYTNSHGSLYIKAVSVIGGANGSSTPLSGNAFHEVYRGQVSILEPSNYLPRAYVTHNAVVEADSKKALALLANPEWDISAATLIDKPLTGAFAPSVNTSSDRVEITRDEPETVEITASIGSAGLLVLNDSYYPGWRATVDGIDTPIIRANEVMRAVQLQPGTHQVRFLYEPTSFRVGSAVSLIASILAVMFVGLARWRPARLFGQNRH